MRWLTLMTRPRPPPRLPVTPTRPPPDALATRLAAALDALPSVRARLEEAADRLERAVGAVEAEAEAGGSGVTAALVGAQGGRGCGLDDGPGGAARRLARDLSTGLPL